MLNIDSDRGELPKLDAAGTGIPALRQLLLSLNARTNHRTLYNHIFITLSSIVDKILRILKKFSEDAGYADMRESIANAIPHWRTHLHGPAESLPKERIMAPWNSMDERNISLGIIEAIDYWRPCHWKTVHLMLALYGNLTSCVKAGMSLNLQVSEVM